jgi:hypothetical protein
MPQLDEKKIRAYHAKADTYVCPVCATAEEKAAAKPGDIVAEDEVHNGEPILCVRCKKTI